jgi:hypothetical protein
LVSRQKPQTIASPRDRWTVRRNAFARLAAVKDGVDNPQVQDLLIRLREKENVEWNNETRISMKMPTTWLVRRS